MVLTMTKILKRLQWKLTLSYAVVTSATIIVLAALSVGIALYTESKVQTRVFNSFYWTKTAFQDNIPYLVNDPPALQKWVERIQAQGFTWTDFQSYTVDETLDYANTLVTESEPIYILDPQLNLLAAAPAVDPAKIGKPFTARLANGIGLESILSAALVGDKNYTAQSFTLPDGRYIAAFPLRKSENDPLTAIAVYTLKPPVLAVPSSQVIYNYTTVFIITLLVMFAIAIPIGAIFGWLASRDLRQRLANLSGAAKAWSHGDFTPAPSDQSPDEVGELTRDLVNMAGQLQSLLHTRDELARMEERNRLARDLHDTVKQQTYASRMQISAAKNLLSSDPSSAVEHLDAALQLNRETQQDLKLIIDELRPAALQGRGLALAMQDYSDRWQEHTGIKVEATFNGEANLPANVEQALYRIFQEAFSNVARHAEADTVFLSLQHTDKVVTITIKDNGRGFEPAAVSPHSLGLNGMRQRMAEIGGTLTVESTLSVGTTIIAIVELS